MVAGRRYGGSERSSRALHLPTSVGQPADTSAAAGTAQIAGRYQYTVLQRVLTRGRVGCASVLGRAEADLSGAARSEAAATAYLAHWHLKLPPTTLWSGCVHNRCRLGSIVSLIPRGTNW